MQKIESLIECGCCGAFHREDYAGDCRNDDERFPMPVLPSNRTKEASSTTQEKHMAATTKNLTATIEDGFLVIKVPLNPTPVRSATGKTLVVASSHGNKETDVQVQGKNVFVGVNAYIK